MKAEEARFLWLFVFFDLPTVTKPEKRASICFSSDVAGRCACSIVFSVRIAAMMSRALVFSPLAIPADAGGS